jgi:hypothetical protein
MKHGQCCLRFSPLLDLFLVQRKGKEWLIILRQGLAMYSRLASHSVWWLWNYSPPAGVLGVHHSTQLKREIFLKGKKQHSVNIWKQQLLHLSLRVVATVPFSGIILFPWRTSRLLWTFPPPFVTNHQTQFNMGLPSIKMFSASLQLGVGHVAEFWSKDVSASAVSVPPLLFLSALWLGCIAL